MPPKTQFSIPLNKTSAAAVPAQRGRRATRTTETIPLGRVDRRAASSTRRSCASKGEAAGPSETTTESYLLRVTEPESDESDEEPDVIADNEVPNVSLLLSCYSDKVYS